MNLWIFEGHRLPPYSHLLGFFILYCEENAKDMGI